MCGRYTLALPLSTLVEAFQVDRSALDELEPRYNIAPTQYAPAILEDDEGGRRLGPLRWGLVPGWADDPSLGNRLINARSETAAYRPTFRSAFRSRRCLVPADGFYEWRGSGTGPKTPFHIRRPDGGALAFAGLWERWRDPEGEEGGALYTFTILTRQAPGWMKPLHHRMPVILPRESWGGWLASDTDVETAEALVTEAGAGPLEAVEVSTRVNSPANEDAGCVEPVPDGERYAQGS